MNVKFQIAKILFCKNLHRDFQGRLNTGFMPTEKFVFGKLNECKISDWKKQMPCEQKEILISSKCQNVKFQIGRSKCQVRVGGEGTLDRHHPIRHWFLFSIFNHSQNRFLFNSCPSFFVKPKWNTMLIFYHLSKLANPLPEMSRD